MTLETNFLTRPPDANLSLMVSREGELGEIIEGSSPAHPFIILHSQLLQ